MTAVATSMTLGILSWSGSTMAMDEPTITGGAGIIGVFVGTVLSTIVKKCKGSSPDEGGENGRAKQQPTPAGCANGHDCPNLRAERERIDSVRREFENLTRSLRESFESQLKAVTDAMESRDAENRREFESLWKRFDKLQEIGYEQLKQSGEANSLLREFSFLLRQKGLTGG